MTRDRLSWNQFLMICLITFIAALIVKAEDPNKTSRSIRFFQVESFLKPYIDRIIQGVDIESWPKTNVLRTAPNIDKHLLPNPQSITRGTISRGEVAFSDHTWPGGGGSCNWDRVVENPGPLPTALPEERKSWLLEHMPSRMRKDPNLVKEYMDRKLNDYRKSKMYRVTGSIRLDTCVAPNSQAACEYLVYHHQGYSAPPESIAGQFSQSHRLEDLGTVGFYENWKGFAKIMFVRDNIALIIDARGEPAEEALLLAQKIDALIQKQPALSYNQLLARRPSITIVTKAEKTLSEEQWMVSFDTSAPADQQIADVKVYVDGQLSWVEDKKVVITNKKKGQTVKIKVVATTSELLTNSFETEVIIPD